MTHLFPIAFRTHQSDKCDKQTRHKFSWNESPLTQSLAGSLMGSREDAKARRWPMFFAPSRLRVTHFFSVAFRTHQSDKCDRQSRHKFSWSESPLTQSLAGLVMGSREVAKARRWPMFFAPSRLRVTHLFPIAFRTHQSDKCDRQSRHKFSWSESPLTQSLAGLVMGSREVAKARRWPMFFAPSRLRVTHLFSVAFRTHQSDKCDKQADACWGASTRVSKVFLENG
ncbi:hypothetical protein Pla52n_26340 [Stieleria varia]|uniref:Uncharacterized protein n=1 Tax=Stieleria varia TaxID=2528005 RepID=A0A5C6AZP8_9BACT|nr:hypothetical protein Pla52n_26340 [Stieleria varia]